MFKETNINCKKITMEKEFIPYEQALDLKELGFDEPCFGYYLASTLFISNDIVYNSTNIPVIEAPLYQQAFGWFRKKHGYTQYVREVKKDKYRFYIEKFDEKSYTSEFYDSHEEAELECLKKLIEIAKNK